MTMIRRSPGELEPVIDSDERRLFDMRADGREAHNIWDDLEHQSSLQQLLNPMLVWRIRIRIRSSSKRG